MSTRARDFKFAGAIVQRLYLVMVALTKNRLSVQYGWFCHGRSHIMVDNFGGRLIFLKIHASVHARVHFCNGLNDSC